MKGLRDMEVLRKEYEIIKREGSWKLFLKMSPYGDDLGKSLVAPYVLQLKYELYNLIPMTKNVPNVWKRQIIDYYREPDPTSRRFDWIEIFKKNYIADLYNLLNCSLILYIQDH